MAAVDSSMPEEVGLGASEVVEDDDKTHSAADACSDRTLERAPSKPDDDSADVDGASACAEETTDQPHVVIDIHDDRVSGEIGGPGGLEDEWADAEETLEHRAARERDGDVDWISAGAPEENDVETEDKSNAVDGSLRKDERAHEVEGTARETPAADDSDAPAVPYLKAVLRGAASKPKAHGEQVGADSASWGSFNRKREPKAWTAKSGGCMWVPKAGPGHQHGYSIKIPQNMIGIVIGKAGKTLKQIMDESGVRVNVDQSTRDKGYSMVEVCPGAGAEKANTLIRKLLSVSDGDSEIASAELRIEQRYVGSLIGPAGETIREMKEQSGATLIFDQQTSPHGYSILRVSGSPEEVENAKEIVHKKVQSIDPEAARPADVLNVPRPLTHGGVSGPCATIRSALLCPPPASYSSGASLAKASEGVAASGSVSRGGTLQVRIDQAQVGKIIGKKGEGLQRIRSQAGVQVEVDQATRAEGFSVVRIGPGPGQPRAHELIMNIMSNAQAEPQPDKPGSEKVIVMEVDQCYVGLIVGKGGETIKSMQAETGALLMLDQKTKDSGFSTVRISGSAKAVDFAQALIEQKIVEIKAANALNALSDAKAAAPSRIAGAFKFDDKTSINESWEDMVDADVAVVRPESRASRASNEWNKIGSRKASPSPLTANTPLGSPPLGSPPIRSSPLRSPQPLGSPPPGSPPVRKPPLCDPTIGSPPGVDGPAGSPPHLQTGWDEDPMIVMNIHEGPSADDFDSGRKVSPKGPTEDARSDVPPTKSQTTIKDIPEPSNLDTIMDQLRNVWSAPLTVPAPIQVEKAKSQECVSRDSNLDLSSPLDPGSSPEDQSGRSSRGSRNSSQNSVRSEEPDAIKTPFLIGVDTPFMNSPGVISPKRRATDPVQVAATSDLSAATAPIAPAGMFVDGAGVAWAPVGFSCTSSCAFPWGWPGGQGWGGHSLMHKRQGKSGYGGRYRSWPAAAPSVGQAIPPKSSETDAECPAKDAEVYQGDWGGEHGYWRSAWDQDGDTASLVVDQRYVGWLIGRNGSSIQDVIDQSGASVYIDQSTKSQAFSTLVVVGHPVQVSLAMELVDERVTEVVAASQGLKAMETGAQKMLHTVLSALLGTWFSSIKEGGDEVRRSFGPRRQKLEVAPCKTSTSRQLSCCTWVNGEVVETRTIKIEGRDIFLGEDGRMYLDAISEKYVCWVHERKPEVRVRWRRSLTAEVKTSSQTSDAFAFFATRGANLRLTGSPFEDLEYPSLGGKSAGGKAGPVGGRGGATKGGQQDFWPPGLGSKPCFRDMVCATTARPHADACLETVDELGTCDFGEQQSQGSNPGSSDECNLSASGAASSDGSADAEKLPAKQCPKERTTELPSPDVKSSSQFQ